MAAVLTLDPTFDPPSDTLDDTAVETVCEMVIGMVIETESRPPHWIDGVEREQGSQHGTGREDALACLPGRELLHNGTHERGHHRWRQRIWRQERHRTARTDPGGSSIG